MNLLRPFPIVAFLLLGLLSLNSCNQSEKKTPKITKDSLKRSSIKDWNKTIPGNFNSEQELFFDSLQIDSFIAAHPLFEEYSASIRKFYNNRHFAFAWYNKKGLIEQAGNLTHRVNNLKDEGINKDVPYRVLLDSMVYAKSTEKPDIKLELMLTAQYFVFAKLAWEGMDASISKSSEWFLPRKKIAYDIYLDSMIKSPAKFADSTVAPVYRQYDLLKTFLIKYRELAQTDKWQPIVADRKSYKPGDSSEVIAQIKTRLYKLADFKGDTTDTHYTDEFLLAVKQFQERSGMSPDGAIGPGTLTELNTPLKSRIRQLLVNMERSRWLPVQVDSSYLGINIPEFKLHVYNADSLLWSGNVVVGQSLHKTVIFSGDMKYVVFSPYWNVPTSIVRNEILPAMRNDKNYIKNHQMEITGYSGGLPIVRQKPGPKNSLGLVKFLFPNSYDIYLHDTPAKSLFGESSRAFSHGCIRVEDPVKLALFLLKDNKGWDANKIKTAMNAGKEQYVTLKTKVPVYIAYFTAFTDRNNRLNFRKDIYGRDEPLANMLLKEE